MRAGQLATTLAVGALALGCTCSHEDAAPDTAASPAIAAPTEALPEPPPPQASAAACMSERCLAHIVDVAPEWTIFERLGVPDPDSVVWIEEAGRSEYVAAARLVPDDVPAPCRPADSECYATWEIRSITVARVEGGCPRATLELQLHLTDEDMVDRPVGSARRFEDDFVDLEELSAGECDAAAVAEEADRALREAAPATPLPVPTGMMACSDLRPSIRVYEGTRDGDALALTRQLSGPPDDAPLPRTFVLEAADLDGDGNEEGIVTRTFEVGTDGERERDCGNYGECTQGAVLRCATGWAVLVEPDYRFGLSVGATRTVWNDRPWRILVETTRLAGSQSEEADRIDEGQPLFSESALVMSGRGYAPAGRAEWYESGECARLSRAGYLADARAMCEQGLAAHPRGRVRGALYYDLGRIAEAQGRIEDAREAYGRSLEARENATVRARLDALPAP